jgi:hypothetical protein
LAVYHWCSHGTGASQTNGTSLQEPRFFVPISSNKVDKRAMDVYHIFEGLLNPFWTLWFVTIGKPGGDEQMKPEVSLNSGEMLSESHMALVCPSERRNGMSFVWLNVTACLGVLWHHVAWVIRNVPSYFHPLWTTAFT